jgi:hypothetical protein
MVVFTILAGTPGAARADGDVVVTNCTNDTQLRQLAGAPGISRITFNCSAGPSIIPISAYTSIQGDVSIDGGGLITLDGNSSSAFFQVFAAARLTLRNITLQNGSSNGIHALENFGAATLEGVRMQGNRTTNQGGALANFGTLLVRASTFASNSAGPTTGTGGAIVNEGSATIENTNFSNNLVSGTSSNGGAIAVMNGTLTLTGGTLSSNSALDGGALWVNSSATASVVGVRFADNSAGYGGAIESLGTLAVSGASFERNRALTGDGGAIWQLGGNTTLTQSNLSASQAATTGGALSCYTGTLAISASTISGSMAGGNGGAIYSACTTTVSNSTLSGNSATGQGGGAIYHRDASGTITATTIAGNSATFGAGVYHQGSGSLSLRATLLTGNITGNCAGVVQSLGYNMSSDTNCTTFVQTGDRQSQTLPLGPLALNGGPTPTHMPLAGNPALNAIPKPCPTAADQRGNARPQGSGCDVGAVELGASIYLPVVVR